MLTVTTEAAQAINELVADRPDAGLRISCESMDDEGVRLELALTVGPAPDDQVIEQQGTHIFVEDEVAELLTDKILDARMNGEREVAFTLLP
jgi:iron-sulfur cluster assembly protein